MRYILPTILFSILLSVSVHGQTLSAQDMYSLAACRSEKSATALLKPLGFKYLPDTVANKSGNATLQYISKRSVAPKKQKNNVACIINPQGKFSSVMFTTPVEQMQRRLLNGFIALGFTGGLKLYGDKEEKITYTSAYEPYVSLTYITSRNTDGTRITAYTFVFTRINR